MNPIRALLAGLAAGVAVFFSDFVLHGLVLGDTYVKYPEVFSQDGSSPFYFLLISVCLAVPAAFLFARTRGNWTPGILGGLTFGGWLGLIGFFVPFYHPLTIEGFPYFLAWCQGGACLISSLVGGAVAGVVYPRV